MSWKMKWTGRGAGLADVAEAAEDLLERLDYECEVEARWLQSRAGEGLLLEARGAYPLDAAAGEALRCYLLPRLVKRCGLQVHPSEFFFVPLQARPRRDVGAEEMARELQRCRPRSSDRAASMALAESDGVLVEETSTFGMSAFAATAAARSPR